MCGICGIIGQGDGESVRAMLGRLVHRGPDDEGLHREPGVALGARRLRVIDPEGGRQPVRNETGTVWAVMNGEIYNYRELRGELLRKGHRLSSRCDTEVLVHLYEDEGLEGFRRLRGMFALALWDRDRDTAWLVRDRLGIKPLYYTVRPGEAGIGTRVIFSSELPSLLEALPDWRVRPQAIVDYLTYLYVPGPDTIVEGVYQLRPGEAVGVSRGRLEFRRYYRPTEEASCTVFDDAEEAKREFLRTLRETVRCHLVSDVPLGLFLSGGLDSASILAMMQAEGTGPVKTFSIGYEHAADRSFNELSEARSLAEQFGAVHTETLVRPDALSLLPRVVEGMGEPFADSSAIPTYLVAELARRSVTVALSGIGGDELFGGYPRYLGLRAASYYQRLPSAVRTRIAAWSDRSIPERGTSRDHLARLKRFLRDGHRPLREQYRRWTTFLPAEWEDRLWSPNLAAQVASDRSRTEADALFDQWPSSDPADRGMGVDLQTYLPDDLLRMGDRMSMTHSLELRVPFCDHDLLALAFRVPPAMRFTGWRLKGFMRWALRGVLPDRILRAPKRGFMVPLARWLREDLHELVRDTLSDEVVRRRDYVKPAYVRWLLQEHQSGRRNCSDQIYALVVLELWQRGLRVRSSEPLTETVPS
jgi:asparagine synthase (glutamine-hydrolysing)